MNLQDFESQTITIHGDLSIFVRMAGRGAPVLLLHGYPQTHVCFHLLAPLLIEAGYRVILTDLRGYGASGKPPSDATHLPYSKRAMAEDQIALMKQLGHDKFLLVGHDRGGRTAHRLAVDHPEAVEKLVLLDIVPTRTMYESANMAFGRAYYHWFFLIQPAPLPERMIESDPEFYLRTKLKAWSAPNAKFCEKAVEQYLTAFRDPAMIHATCEDYRAAASIDLSHERNDLAAGRMIECPVLCLWGTHGFIGRNYKVKRRWQEVSRQAVIGKELDCGHFLAEEKPEKMAEHLVAFFNAA